MDQIKMCNVKGVTFGDYLIFNSAILLSTTKHFTLFQLIVLVFIARDRARYFT